MSRHLESPALGRLLASDAPSSTCFPFRFTYPGGAGGGIGSVWNAWIDSNGSINALVGFTSGTGDAFADQPPCDGAVAATETQVAGFRRRLKARSSFIAIAMGAGMIPIALRFGTDSSGCARVPRVQVSAA